MSIISTALDLGITVAVSEAKAKWISLTWGNINLTHLGLRDIDVNSHFAFCEVDLHIAQIICKVTEEQETIGVPSPELETDWEQVLLKPSRHLQVTCSIEKDRYRIGLHTRETQISL